MSDTLRTARISAAATFVVHALVSGSWAPRIPALKADLGLDNGELGIALSGLAAGLLVGTRIAGRAVDRMGTRRPIRLGLPILCLTLVGPALATDLLGLTASFVGLGVISGFLDVAMNANGVAVERGYRRPILAGLHAFWSGGLLAGSAVSTGAAALGAGLLLHFGLLAAALTPFAVVATRGLLSAEARITPDNGPPPRRAASLPVLLLGLVAFCAFAGEGSAADWSAVYMNETVGSGPGLAGVTFVSFSFGMIACRAFGDALSTRFGPTTVVRWGGAIAAGGMTLALVAPHPSTTIAGYLLFGVGLAPVVPIAFSAAGNLDQGRAAVVLSSVVTIGYVGSVAGPLVIGLAADAVGLRVALLLPVALALGVATLGFSAANAAGGRRGTPERVTGP